MEHELLADADATIQQLEAKVGDAVSEGQVLAVLGPPNGAPAPRSCQAGTTTPTHDCTRSGSATRSTRDPARPDAVEQRHDRGHRTARENLDDLLDPGSFVEYGPLDLCRPGAPTVKAGADRAHSGRRAGRRRRRDRRRAVHRDVLRLHGPRRHPGDAQPRQEGPAVRARRAPTPAGGAVRRGRRRPARRHRHADRRRASTAVHSSCSPASAGSCRWSGSRRATASPATRRCSAAATW